MARMGRLAAVLLALGCLSTNVAGVPVKAQLLHAGDSNFTSVVHNGKHAFYLVDFYAPWCGHCKQLDKQLPDVVATLAAKDASVGIVKVNAEESPELKEKYAVKGYPTLMLFKKGHYERDYPGPRAGAQITNFLLKQVSQPIEEITAETVTEYVKRGTPTSHCTFVAVGMAVGTARDERVALANQTQKHKDELWFGHISDKDGEFRTHYGVPANKPVVFAFDEEHGVQGSIKAPFNEDMLASFIELHRWTPLLPLTQATFPQAAKSERPMVLLLVRQDLPITKKLLDAAVPVSTKRRADYLFATVDVNQLGKWAEDEFGLESGSKDGVAPYPAVVVYNRADLSFYHDYAWRSMGASYASALEHFLDAVESGTKPKQTIHSASVDQRVMKMGRDIATDYPEVAMYAPAVVLALGVLLYMFSRKGKAGPGGPDPEGGAHSSSIDGKKGVKRN